MGKIGFRIAQYLTALGMNVIYNNRRKVPNSMYEFVSLDDLLVRSDGIILACPSTPDTRHIINETSLEKMKNDTIIVNISMSS